MKQKIIITGGAGFIGSNFLNKYVLAYPDIDFINVDCLTYAGRLRNIRKEVQESPNYFFRNVDIRNIEALREVYREFHPMGIIHFAAETHVDRSIEEPRIFTETNILGTQNLLDLQREFALLRFHHISTDEVYGDLPKEGFFTESSPIRPSSPYSVSKASGDLLVAAYSRTYGLNTVITRSSNNYGPHQYSEKFIPRSVDLLRNNLPIILYGDGENIRDWLYVEDHCDAIWEVYTRAPAGSVYNIGAHHEYSNLEIARILLRIFGKSEAHISYVRDRPGHDLRYAIDTSKIEHELGWKPKADFATTIMSTVQHSVDNPF